MNVTLAIDKKLLARARRLARQRQTTVNQLIRDYLERLTAGAGNPTVAAEFERLWSEDQGHSRGWKWNRDELHDRT
jgi:hypothetical protein